MPRQPNEGMLQRDVRTVWRTITIVGTVLLALGGLAITAVAWYSDNNARMTAIELRLGGLDKAVAKLERAQEWHQRGHASPTK